MVLTFSKLAKYLCIEQNGMAGTIPLELNRLKNLRYLLLEEGILTGTIPSELGEIQALEQIDLNFNLLAGPIPEEIFFLSNLRQLDLNDNELTGSISTNIAMLSDLSFFQIENNFFMGTVPTQMGSLTSLGTHPITIVEALGLTVAQSLDLSHTVFHIDLSHTEVATMDNNRLSGTMPCEFLNAIGAVRVLTSDCLGAPNRPSPPLVVCDCCTQCF